MTTGADFRSRITAFPPIGLVAGCLFLSAIFYFGNAYAQEFETTDVSERVRIMADPEIGRQVVVQSARGLVVFDTFWSETSARRFKQEIIETLGRDDFAYVINMVDRLDMLGGNAVYPEAAIVGQSNVPEKYEGREQEVEAEIQDLIEMWRWKADVARERLPSYEEGSDKWEREQAWIHTCDARADELESGFSLVLPAITYNDRMTLDLGDITLELIWFGRAGNYNGLTVAVIPEESLAIVNGAILSIHHLAPYPYWAYGVLDVPRWIAVLEEVLEGEEPVGQVVCSDLGLALSGERARSHLEYIRKLWSSVEAAEAEGQDLSEIQDRLSLDAEFAFVKEMQVYKDDGDDWVRPQHAGHVRMFFLQHKDFIASEMIRAAGSEGMSPSIEKVKSLDHEGRDIYLNESDINAVGYYYMNMGKIPEAIEVFKLNAGLFPHSSNVYDSLGEAYMKNGDKENAIANYRKSLELDPENGNATEMLKTLVGT
jgi:tetratricopeptide (TPR) repeat protein